MIESEVGQTSTTSTMDNAGKKCIKSRCRLVLLTIAAVVGINIGLVYFGTNIVDTTYIAGQQLYVTRSDQLYRRTNSSYLMALSYHEQLNTAVKYEILSLANIAADWGLRIVEPFVVNSRMYGLKSDSIVPPRDKDQAGKALPLGSLLNTTSILSKCSNVEITPFEQFKSHVPDKVILIVPAIRDRIPPREIVFTKHPEIWRSVKVQLKESRNGIIDCTSSFLSSNDYSAKALITGIESSLKFNGRNPKVVKIICFNESALLSTSHFQSYLSPSGTEVHSTVVIFLNWRGCFIFDCSAQAYQKWKQSGECQACPSNHPNIHRFRVITNSSLTDYAYCTERPIPHSEGTINVSRRYLKMLNKPKPLIGIHLRFERLSRVLQNSVCLEGLLNSAISSFIKLANRMGERPTEHILVISDNSPRGSDTCRGSRCASPARNMEIMLNNQWAINTTIFVPELTGSPDHNGYVSIVEMNMLILCDYLIIVGHGNFQEQLVGSFLASGKPNSRLLWIGKNNKCIVENVHMRHAHAFSLLVVSKSLLMTLLILGCLVAA